MPIPFSIWVGATYPHIPPEQVLLAVAMLIKSDGEVHGVFAIGGDGKIPTSAIQELVGGPVSILRMPWGLAVVNEVARERRLPLNNEATRVLRRYLRPDDFIVGDCIMIKEGAMA